MKKIVFLYLLIALVGIGIVFSHGEEDFADAKQIIENKVPCSELAEDQLEHIGDYYMEQMHPGEAHELMDKMIGGEGSESLNQMHIIMAKSLYCNEDIGGIGGMMGMMNMMGGGMMNMAGSSMMGYGMMGNFGYGSGYLSFVNLLYAILLIGLIILVYLWIFRLLKGAKIKGGKNK